MDPSVQQYTEADKLPADEAMRRIFELSSVRPSLEDLRRVFAIAGLTWPGDEQVERSRQVWFA